MREERRKERGRKGGRKERSKEGGREELIDSELQVNWALQHTERLRLIYNMAHWNPRFCLTS